MMTEPTPEEDVVNAGEIVKPEICPKFLDCLGNCSLKPDCMTHIQFQYATAGDARRLVEHIGLLTRQNEELQRRLTAWEECARYDPMMSGQARFKGWDRSGLDRCRHEMEQHRVIGVVCRTMV